MALNQKNITMKKTIVVLFSGLLALIACAQNANPPEAVSKAFSDKFGTVKGLKWDQEDDEWEAEFKMNGTEMSASFDQSGTWLETETEIKEKDLPENIMNAVNAQFEGWEIEEAEKIETPDFKGYELAIEQDENEKEILVSEDGNITIKKEEREDEEDEDE